MKTLAFLSPFIYFVFVPLSLFAQGFFDPLLRKSYDFVKDHKEEIDKVGKQVNQFVDKTHDAAVKISDTVSEKLNQCIESMEKDGTIQHFSPSGIYHCSRKRIVIYMNGMRTDFDSFCSDAQCLSDTVGSPVLGVYAGGVTRGWATIGLLKLSDLSPEFRKALSNSLIEIQALAIVMNQVQQENLPIDLVAHSRGTMIFKDFLTDNSWARKNVTVYAFGCVVSGLYPGPAYKIVNTEDKVARDVLGPSIQDYTNQRMLVQGPGTHRFSDYMNNLRVDMYAYDKPLPLIDNVKPIDSSPHLPTVPTTIPQSFTPLSVEERDFAISLPIPANTETISQVAEIEVSAIEKTPLPFFSNSKIFPQSENLIPQFSSSNLFDPTAPPKIFEESNEIPVIHPNRGKSQFYVKILLGLIILSAFSSIMFLLLPKILISIHEPDQKSRVVICRRTEIWIGRSQESQIIVNDPTVSRKHLHVFFQHHHVWVKDNQSPNGTFYEQQRIIEAIIPYGKKIQVGKTIMIFNQSSR